MQTGRFSKRRLSNELTLTGSVQLGEFETSEPELNRLIAAADEAIGAPLANEIGFRSARSLRGQELACVIR